MKIKAFIYLVSSIICLSSCSNNEDISKHKIVCTTGMIGDLVKNIAPDSIDVLSIMGPGVDPHLFKPSSSDIKALKNADLIFYNGLHLEGKAQEILEKLSNKQAVYAISDGLPKSTLIPVSDIKNTYDPHIWHDISNWLFCLDYVKKKLIHHYPQFKSEIEDNSLSYQKQLEETDFVIKELINEIPENQRYLVTAHDAFSYFGRAYKIKVKALQGISTASEFGLQDVVNLSDFLSAKRIKAVFVESSVPTKTLEKVIEACTDQKHEVHIGGHLYSDALGDSTSSSGTYIGMLLHNSKTISENLK